MSNKRRRPHPARPVRPAPRAHARRHGMRLVQPESTQASLEPVALDLEGDVTAQLLKTSANSIGSVVPLPVLPGESAQVVDELKKLIAQFIGTRFVRIFEGHDEAAESFIITISMEPMKGDFDA